MLERYSTNYSRPQVRRLENTARLHAHRCGFSKSNTGTQTIRIFLNRSKLLHRLRAPVRQRPFRKFNAFGFRKEEFETQEILLRQNRILPNGLVRTRT